MFGPRAAIDEVVQFTNRPRHPEHVAARSPDYGAKRRRLSAPLPLSESLLIAWPRTVGLIAAKLFVLFIAGYVLCQRVRA
ncbi:hypothetical protein SAMN05216338_1009139 [Bradyrhizobium sp. Rc2d]|nr:hypothetical protein SAMN05216338_1009139 [Bradyrhizobium sp. Rc2d]